MAKVERPRELLLAQLEELLYVEQQLANEVIPALLSEAENGRLKQGLTLHSSQTQDHVANLRKIFELLGEEPKAEKSRVVDALENLADEEHALQEAEQVGEQLAQPAAAVAATPG